MTRREKGSQYNAILAWRCTKKDHVIKGAAGSFCQLCHGRKASQQRMRRGEHTLYYSPGQASCCGP